MNYYDGEPIRLGDVADLGAGLGRGTVVCIIGEGIASPGWNISEWLFLKVGVVFNTATAGEIHYTQADEDTLLIKRSEA